jgi:polysaccharide biosynthesis protein PslH
VPFPLEKGDKLRAYHQLRILSKAYEISLIALTHEEVHPKAEEELAPFCSDIHFLPIGRVSVVINLIRALFNGNPLQVGYFFNRGTYDKVQSIVKSFDPAVIYGQLLRVAEYMPAKSEARTVLDYQDTFSKGVDRRRVRSFGLMKQLMAIEFKRLVRYEKLVFEKFDACTIISEQDRQYLPIGEKNAVTIVRNGVDMEFFHPQERPKNTDVLFAGNMGYPPNVLACEFLGRDVLPLLKRENPEIRITLSGARPAASIVEMASDNIEVTGWVDDMRDSYSRTKLFVAPMMIGTGLQNKLLEAMSMGIPCITTPLANNALHAGDGHQIILATSPKDFSDRIMDLLADPEKAIRIGQAGREFVLGRYGWSAQTQPLLETLKGTS